MIHKTHTRKDVIQIIETYNIDIVGYEDLSKPLLFEEVWNKIMKMESSQVVDHLKLYLKNVNQNRIKITERDKYIDIAKTIIFYIKNDCLLSYTNYLSEDDLVKDIKMICHYCKLPTCYRAVTMLNNTGKFKEKFEPIVTGKTKVLLRKKEQERLFKANRVMFRTKQDNDNRPFIITFE
jgi:hypothetical protein